MRCLLVLLGLGLIVSCKSKQPQEEKKADRITIGSVEVIDRTAKGNKVPGVNEEVIEGWVKQKLRAAGLIVTKKEKKKTKQRADLHHLKIELGIGRRESDKGVIQRVVLISARAAVPGDLDRFVLSATGIHHLPSTTEQSRQRSRVRTFLLKVMDDLVFQATLSVAPIKKLVEALAQKDVHRLSTAVEIAAVRRARPTVPRLIALLKHDKMQISDRAIGALVAIGDRRAVKPLTRLSKFRDTAKMAKILDGIGALGGKEARDYLEFVSTGHDDADIRNLASEALVRLKRRADAGKKKK